MSFVSKVKLSLSIAICTSLFLSIISFADTSEKIRSEVLRLHVVANSDSQKDQCLKLKVRDAVLDAGADIFDGTVNIENAKTKIEPEIDYLTSVAKKIINENGFDYDVKIYLNNEYFNTRTYENVTLPAGEYLALKIVIGEGRGRNWWCVMFPPMCLSAADEEKELKNVLASDEVELVKRDPKFEPRFKIVEIIESIKAKLEQRN